MMMDDQPKSMLIEKFCYQGSMHGVKAARNLYNRAARNLYKDVVAFREREREGTKEG
jgi:hypothetical protein